MGDLQLPAIDYGALAPMLILFLLLQRRFIDGLSSSGLGGA